MPEGPEVRRMAEGLERRICGKDLESLEILGGKWLKKEPTGFGLIQEELRAGPLTVRWVRVKGKFIYAALGDIYMWNTLGMSGGWRDNFGKHSHLIMRFSNGPAVYFEDIRRFGNISFHSDWSEISAKLKAVGPDLLNDEVGFPAFREALLKKSRWNICKALMDQKVVSGVGNYIKSESLYRAGISPWKTVADVPDDSLRELWVWTRRIIKTSYDQGGATLSTYTDMDGNAGDFVFSFHVYRKEKDPFGNEVTHEITPDGRMTHWVKGIQI
jgi:DNA-formamidopyrimidine glycosylase